MAGYVVRTSPVAIRAHMALSYRFKDALMPIFVRVARFPGRNSAPIVSYSSMPKIHSQYSLFKDSRNSRVPSLFGSNAFPCQRTVLLFSKVSKDSESLRLTEEDSQEEESVEYTLEDVDEGIMAL